MVNRATVESLNADKYYDALPNTPLPSIGTVTKTHSLVRVHRLIQNPFRVHQFLKFVKQVAVMEYHWPA